MDEQLQEIHDALEERRDSWVAIRNGFDAIFPERFGDPPGSLTEAGQAIQKALSMCIGDTYQIMTMIQELKEAKAGS